MRHTMWEGLYLLSTETCHKYSIYIFSFVDTNGSMLPLNSTSPAMYRSPHTQSTPKSLGRGDTSSRRVGIQDVIAKVEMDTSIHVWKAAAEKVS